MIAKKVLTITGIALLVTAYGFSYSSVVSYRDKQPRETKRAQALAVDARVLKIISGPFKGIMADYLLLKASIFMGGAWEVTPEDWNAVYLLLKQSLALDPLFFQTGYYTQGLLAWRKGMHEKAVELLKYHAEKRYWDWEPMFYLGFDYFYYLKDNEKAVKYMRMAAERPGAPLIATTLAARLAQRGGQTLTAIALLKEMYAQANSKALKDLYAKRLKAHLAIYEIEQTIERFRREKGHNPGSLEELVGSGILPALPDNPFGDHFIYESDTGRVYFDKQR